MTRTPTPDPAVEPTIPWGSFEDLFRSPRVHRETYLVELHHARGTRHQWSYEDWGLLVEATTNQLNALGVGPGSVVATLAGNTADAVALAHACWLIGACIMPLNPSDRTDRLSFILADARASLLVYTPEFEERSVSLAEATSTRTRATAEVMESHRVAPGRGFKRRVDLSVDALRIYTSGTTGDPKGVCLSMRNLLVHTDSLAQASGWTIADTVMTVLPIHHVNGLLIGCLLPYALGSTAVLSDRFRSDHFWADVATESATVSSVVPSLLEFLLAEDDQPETPLRELFCGAGPLLPETVTTFEDRFSTPVRHLYGLSETTAVATLMPVMGSDQRRELYTRHGFPSIGCAIPNVDVAVVDAAGGPVASGERGELAVRGATVMSGYRTPTPVDTPFADGWFLTGDQGFWEPHSDEAYYFITGRTKELIIRGGVNIAPVEIDRVLAAHPAVKFALALPFENRFYGEEVAAYVVTSGQVTEQQLLDHCRGELGFARSPKVIVMGDDVPFTATGKAKRIELRDRLAHQLAQYRDVQFRAAKAPAQSHPEVS